MGVSASRPDDHTGSDDGETDRFDSRPDITQRTLNDDDRDSSNLLTVNSTVFKWNHGGQSVYVTGAWDYWRVKHQLEPDSHRPNELFATLALPAGTFQYKFIVDGNWQHNSQCRTEQDQHGNLNNVVTVKAYVPEYANVQPIMEPRCVSPLSSYDYSTLLQEDQTTEPPALPRLLASAPLDKLTDSTSSGTDFVRFNHMFATNCDAAYGSNEIRTIASETRYKSKVITTILISPKNKMQQPVLRVPQPFRPNRTLPIPIRNEVMERSVQPMGENQSLILDALNNV